MVIYPFWVQTLLHYTTQHEGGRHIDFRQMSISPGQTMRANNCKTAFSLHVVESASDDYNFQLYNNINVKQVQQHVSFAISFLWMP